MAAFYAVLELGDPLGFMRYADRVALSKRVEALGGAVATVVDERVEFVISRDVTEEEFDSSLSLQHAIKSDVPIVYVSCLDALVPNSTPAARVAHFKAHLVRIPPSCIERLRASTHFTTLAKVATTVEVMMYSEATAIEAANERVPLPPGYPSWTAHQLEAYDVVRQVMCTDGFKVELHLSQMEPTAGAPQAAAALPFRIMCCSKECPIGIAEQALFFSSAPSAQLAFRRCVGAHAGVDLTAVPTKVFGSIRSCAACVGTNHTMGAAQETIDFAEFLYSESWRCIQGASSLSIDTTGESSLGSKTLLDVIKAESLICRMGEVLEMQVRTGEGETSAFDAQLALLSKKFFDIVPKGGTLQRICNASDLELACDVTRSLRAMLSVGEASCGNIYNAPPSVKLEALGCVIRPLSREHSDYQLIHDLMSSCPRSGCPMPTIVSVFKTYSEESADAFRRGSKSIGNHQLLFHGTRSSNLLPILRDGLQLPLIARLRRDAGMLGRGIYFGDSVFTALKYTPMASTGRYWVLVSLVALGRPYDVREHRLDLVAAPDGYDSVHGIPSSSGAFTEDEFVVYEASRSLISYAVELEYSDRIGTAQAVLRPMALPVRGAWCSNGAGREAASHVNEFLPPNVKDMESGLRTSTGQLVPLRNTRIRGRLIDLIAEVDVLQQYSNDSSVALETKYIFPLQSGCAVCAFEAYINDKKIVGKVKEKEAARKEYNAAVERGDGAYLLDESEETPDVFTVSVGNLPPKTDVVIRITYVLELRVHPALQAIEFIIPSAVVPTSEKQRAVKTQSKTHTEWSDDAAERVGVELSLDMPFDIVRIECSQPGSFHRKRSACRAVMKANHVDLATGDFVLYTYIRSISTPRIWIEKHPELESSVAMITFFPEVDGSAPSSTPVTKEVAVLVDCSASMKSGGAMEAAKQICILSLRALPRHWKFNVILFGSSTITLFPTSRKASLENVTAAARFVQDTAGPWLGGSCLGSLLPSMARFAAAEETTLDVLLISDGLLPASENSLFNSLRALPALRIFAMAVGRSSSSTTLHSLSIAARGRSEVFADSSKSKWTSSVDAHVRRMGQDALSHIRVDWCTEQSRRLRDAANALVQQSPQFVPSLFSRESTVVYGILHHNNSIQCELTAVHCGRTVERDAYGEWPSQSFLVTTNGLSFINGSTIHRLCAKSRIREYTDGVLTMDGSTANEAMKEKTKQSIIDLGCLYGLVTPFTSMIAVEERTAEERAGIRSITHKPTPPIDSVGPGVDILPEEVFEDALQSDEEDSMKFSIVVRQRKKHIKAEQKRKEEARRRRLDDEWVRPLKSLTPPADVLELRANSDDDDDGDVGSCGGMGSRHGTAASALYTYAAPDPVTLDEPMWAPSHTSDQLPDNAEGASSYSSDYESSASSRSDTRYIDCDDDDTPRGCIEERLCSAAVMEEVECMMDEVGSPLDDVFDLFGGELEREEELVPLPQKKKGAASPKKNMVQEQQSICGGKGGSISAGVPQLFKAKERAPEIFRHQRVDECERLPPPIARGERGGGFGPGVAISALPCAAPPEPQPYALPCPPPPPASTGAFNIEPLRGAAPPKPVPVAAAAPSFTAAPACPPPRASAPAPPCLPTPAAASPCLPTPAAAAMPAAPSISTKLCSAPTPSNARASRRNVAVGASEASPNKRELLSRNTAARVMRDVEPQGSSDNAVLGGTQRGPLVMERTSSSSASVCKPSGEEMKRRKARCAPTSMKADRAVCHREDLPVSAAAHVQLRSAVEDAEHEQICEAFAACDPQDRGFVTPAEMQRMAAQLGEASSEEISKEFHEWGLGSDDRIDFSTFTRMMKGEPTHAWSARTLRLGNLPAHFTIEQLRLDRHIYSEVDRCPSTGMCVGTARVDFGSSSTSTHSQESTVSVAVLRVLLTARLYGWSVSGPFELRDLITDLRSLNFLLQGRVMDSTKVLEKWFPLLNEMCGLPAGALQSLFEQHYAMVGATDADTTVLPRMRAMRSFGDAVHLLLQRQVVPLAFKDLERLVLPYSACYIEHLDCFVPMGGVPEGAVHALPFPFSTVITDARNYYDHSLFAGYDS